MVGPFQGAPLDTLSLLALVVGIAFSAAVLARLGTPRVWYDHLSARFVMGVPWGSLVVLGWVVFVYYVVQGGLWHPFQPLVVAFRSWSYFYPVGMLLAPFSHAGMGHLTGNLLAAVVFAPLAEYAWGHYRPASAGETAPALLDRPGARIAVFVVGVLAVGLLTSLFVPGPLIGFSGVVFALAGFALVTHPIATVFAVVGGQLFRLAYFAFRNPVVTAEARQRFLSPYWAEIAIQAHVLGLLVGIVLALLVLRRRGSAPDPTHVWFAGGAYAVSESLYAFYWYEGANRFVMFRGAGLAAVLVFAGLIPLAIGGRSRQLVPDGVREAVPALGPLFALPRRRAVFAVLVAPVLAISMVAVPFNAVDLSGTQAPNDGVRVGDYRITYAENVADGSLGAVSVPFVSDSVRVRASGVIVTNPSRHVWEEVVAAGRLAFDGRARVTVGGLGWRETVVVNRTAWHVVDGGSTYTVYVSRADGPTKRVFVDDPVRVPAVLDGRRVQIRPTADGYDLDVLEGNVTRESSPMPPPGETVTVQGLTFNRTDGTLAVEFDRTKLQIARLKVRERVDE
jgi:membrane associated rhomboid family serine protease